MISSCSRSHAEFEAGFAYAGLAIALTAGFGYGGVLSVLIGFDLPIGNWFVSAIQAHGHAQLHGWLGLFILGVSLHFVPRMAGVPVCRPGLPRWVCGLTAGGILLRCLSQPLMDIFPKGDPREAFRWGMGAAALMEGAGIGLYLLLMVVSLRGRPGGPGRDGLRQARPFLLTALVGWALSISVAACLTFGAFLEDRSVLDLAWSRFGAEVFLALVLLPMGMAFSLRTFPLYLRLATPRWPVRTLWAAYLCGVGMEMLPFLARMAGFLPVEGGGAAISGAGRVLKGASLAWFVWELDLLLRRKAPWTEERVGEPGPGRRKTRENMPDYGEFGRFERLLVSSSIWLFSGAVLDAGAGVTVLLKGGLPVHADAVRHVYLAGFGSLMLLGMAPRMMPGFVHVRRLACPALVDGSFWAGNLAAFFRVVPLLLPPDLLARDPRFARASTWAFGLSGILGWGAVAFLAWNLAATIRSKESAGIRLK